MEKMQYKTFLWPQNPHTYRENAIREPMHEKDKMDQILFLGMGPLKRTITGSGVFFGDGAFNSFRALAQLLDETTPGTLVHPIWGSRNCYFTELELTQEPKENYVSYRFAFQQADANGNLPK